MHNNIKSQVISLDVYDIKQKKGRAVKVKGRPFHSISYRKQGVVKIDLGEEKFLSKNDCITFIPKKRNYSTEIIKDTHMIAIHFDVVDNSAFSVPFMLTNNNQKLTQLFDLVLNNYSGEDFINYECYSCFYKILAEIEKLFLKKAEAEINPAVSKAKEIIEKNFHDNNFNINSLVESINISASYLRSEFKRHYSITPIEYLKYIRLQSAISLLASNYNSLEDVALKSGYSSASYFIQSFRKSTGFSPLKYREHFLDN